MNPEKEFCRLKLIIINFPKDMCIIKIFSYAFHHTSNKKDAARVVASGLHVLKMNKENSKSVSFPIHDREMAPYFSSEFDTSTRQKKKHKT